jgi:cyclophilin family peptidyl-prolyl cis-trans isomerase
VGTVKRERQKANRQVRLEEIQRQQRKDRTKRRVLVWGAIIILGGAAAYGISLLVSKDDNGTATGSATSVTVDPLTTTTVFQPSTVPAQPLAGDTPCPAADGSSPRVITFEKPPPNCIDATKTYTAAVKTNKGEFTVTLDAKTAPQTTNNFVVLARYHYYDGVVCHRIITDFVVQCGDPTGTGSGPNPGYTIPDELPAAGAYKDGSLAMANTGQANTGGGQFFIITGPQGQQLPPQYSLFGQVAQGFDTTVKAMAAAADPNASNGTPTLEPIYLESVTITES